MQLPGFIPEELRQLARFVPLTGWDAVEWKPLLGSLRSVTWRYVTGQGVAALARAAGEAVPAVTFTDTLDGTTGMAALRTARQRRAAGDDILRLYFGQWLVDEGLFIDLRPGRFGVAGGETRYRPDGLWIRLRPRFREGMIALYRSFYSGDDAAFDQALRQMGMLRPGLPAAAEAELRQRLHVHFGIEQDAQRFSIDAFKASFDDLFEFFIEHDYRLHSDFVWVGFYLVTLYLALEALGQTHDVRGICAEMLLHE